MTRTIIAVHPPFAWLVDWAALMRDETKWVLVTNHASRARLMRDGMAQRFEAVVVADHFDADGIASAAARWLPPARDPAQLRIATMIEQTQMPVAELRRRYGLFGPGPDALRPFTDKLAMKAAMRGVDEYLPNHLAHDPDAFACDPDGYVERIVAALGLPIFAKPAAENSSAGTARLDNEAALRDFLVATPYCGALELDEYVQGDGYHLDSVIVDGRITWFGAGLYAAPQGDTLHGAPLAGISIGPGDAQYPELAALNQRLLGAFAYLPDGCTHMEVLRRPDGRYVFLEVAARVPGARCPEMHRISRGLDLRRVHYEILAGLRPTLREYRGPHAGYYCPMKTREGRIARFVAPKFACEHSVEWADAWRDRTDVARTMAQADCLGYFVMWSPERGVLERDVAALRGFEAYELVR